jgi:hypothetical protein
VSLGARAASAASRASTGFNGGVVSISHDTRLVLTRVSAVVSFGGWGRMKNLGFSSRVSCLGCKIMEGLTLIGVFWEGTTLIC